MLVNTRFQVLFHSPLGVLFTFPSQYFFAIGHQFVFRLGGWSPLLPTRFLVSRGTLDTTSCTLLRIRGYYSLWRRLSSPSSARLMLTYRSPQPRTTEVFRFGLFRFRSPLLTESRLISLPGPTEMFQFNPSSLVHLCIQCTMHGCLVHACFHIRKSPDQRIFAPPRGLSQLVTSFFGDWCQGIRPALLVT